MFSIKKTVGAVSFPSELGDMAVMVFNSTKDSREQNIIKWLNNKN